MDNKIIKYWGDAKYKAKKSVLDFRGNNKVFEIWKIKKISRTISTISTFH